VKTLTEHTFFEGLQVMDPHPASTACLNVVSSFDIGSFSFIFFSVVNVRR